MPSTRQHAPPRHPPHHHQGGGNCGNALTAAARLGLAPAIVTKIGGDGVGDGILSEFKVSNVLGAT